MITPFFTGYSKNNLAILTGFIGFRNMALIMFMRIFRNNDSTMREIDSAKHPYLVLIEGVCTDELMIVFEEGNMRASGTPIVQVGERRRTDSFVYDLVCFLLGSFSYDVVGLENIQTAGPAIYLSNHLGPTGPIETILSIPIRLYPWGITEMTDPTRAPKYLFDDFVHPVLHLNGRVGLWLANVITKISIPLFNSIGVVPIDRFGGWTADGFRHSLRLLHEGKNLLIFPENSVLELDPETSMRHFMPGFATLCSLFQREGGFALPVYPVAVNAESETVAIGKAEYFRPQRMHHQAIDTFSQLMETRVRALYLELKQSAESIE
jgi:hypothetical protein